MRVVLISWLVKSIQSLIDTRYAKEYGLHMSLLGLTYGVMCHIYASQVSEEYKLAPDTIFTLQCISLTVFLLELH